MFRALRSGARICHRTFSSGKTFPQKLLGGRSVGCVGLDVGGLLVNEPNIDDVVPIAIKAVKSGLNILDICDAGKKGVEVAKLVLQETSADDIVIAAELEPLVYTADSAQDGADCVDVRSECERVLNALQLAQLPLGIASARPDSVDALQWLREQDMVAMVGVGGVDLASAKSSLKALDASNFAAIRQRVSVVNRSSLDTGLLSLCDKHNIALMAARPFGPPENIEALQHHPLLRQIAAKHDTSVLQVCLSWLMLSSCVIPLSPLSSTRLDAVNIDLDIADLELFEQIQSEM